MLAEELRSATREPHAPEWDQKEMPFTEHLRELRSRLLVSLTTIGVLAVAMFWPSQFMINWIRREYLPGIQLHAFAPTDGIFVEFKFSLYAALVLGLPVLLYQAWMFIVPAFHPRTRRMVYAYTAPSLVLALCGLAFCHFFIIKRILAATLAITNEVAQPTFGLEPTLNLILMLFLAFAIVFQTPMVLIALARIGLVNAAMLRTYRRYAAMAMLLLGGLAAPDASPVTMLLLAVPMYVLYEISIWLIVALERGWQRSGSP